MDEKKRAYTVGEDGRLYFAFNLEAEYELKPPVGEAFTYRVNACEWDELTETEYFRISSAGEELPARFSVQQLRFMLGQLPCKQTEEGEPVELPLITEEVREFFGAKHKQLNKLNVAANEKLKGTAFKKNLPVIKTIRENLIYLKSVGDDEQASELEKRLAKLEAEQSKILSDKGIDVRILTKTADCPLCGDSGVKGGRICECAYALADKIKAYNADRRRLNAAKRGNP